jgi:hypothetical protein
MFGASPYIVPPRWHTPIIDWREGIFRKRLMGRQDLEEFDIEIRKMYFQIAAEVLNPTPPRLANTDGDPLRLTTLIYELKTSVDNAYEKLAPLAKVHGEDHIGEIARDESGSITSAVLSWAKAGNRQHKDWDNTILGRLALEAGRLTAEVNSARRAGRLKREIAKRLADAAILVDTKVVDPSEALAERQRERGSGARTEPPHETPPELRAVEDELIRRHWKAWLDTRVPALGNKTPRQAARSAGGRERLEALLAEFAAHDHPGTRNAAAHLAFIREKLRLPKQL